MKIGLRAWTRPIMPLSRSLIMRSSLGPLLNLWGRNSTKLTWRKFILQHSRATLWNIQTFLGNGRPKLEGRVGKQTELEHLKDSIPAAQASKALYGETSMDGASGVLNKHYSNPDLRANKLKLQLKNIKPRGQGDQDVVLDLATEVNNVVLRLKSLSLKMI